MEDGRYEKKEFKTEDQFWTWFFIANSRDPSSNLFDDFRLSGCWNWIIDGKDSGEFNDTIQRLEASKLGISPTSDSYDNSPAVLVEHLVYAHSELKKAEAKWLKKHTQ